MSKYPYLREPGDKKYRLIEIDTTKQSWIGQKRQDELEYTTIIGDYDDWDEAVAALNILTHPRCRRLLWSVRGCAGQNHQGDVWVNRLCQ